MYSDDKTDFVEHMRLLHKKATETEMSDSQKIQTIMAFAIALRILGYKDVFSVFMKESKIVNDEKYREMFQDFFNIGRF